jgi:hypothetical protein
MGLEASDSGGWGRRGISSTRMVVTVPEPTRRPRGTAETVPLRVPIVASRDVVSLKSLGHHRPPLMDPVWGMSPTSLGLGTPRTEQGHR